MKSTPTHVCAKTAFVGWPSTESRWITSFHNFLSFSHYFRKYFKLLYRKNVVMVTLTTGIMCLLFTFGRAEFHEGGPRVSRPPMRWSAIAVSLRNNGIWIFLVYKCHNVFQPKTLFLTIWRSHGREVDVLSGCDINHTCR
jgi:hypothetical protein